MPVLAAMVEDISNLSVNGSDIDHEVVCLLFPRALPDEYGCSGRCLSKRGKGSSSAGFALNCGTSTISRKGGNRHPRGRQTALFLQMERGGEMAYGVENREEKGGGLVARTLAMAKAAGLTRAVIVTRHRNPVYQFDAGQVVQMPPASSVAKRSMIRTSFPRRFKKPQIPSHQRKSAVFGRSNMRYLRVDNPAKDG